MSDWISQAASFAGYVVAFALLLVPIALGVWFYRTRAFRRRHRIRWAGERIAPWSLRDPMEELPPPLGDEPPHPSRKRA